MSPALRSLSDQLSALLDGARPVLLPAPFSAGHFRVRTALPLPETPLFTARRRGETLFVTLSDAALLAALQSEPLPAALPEPSRSPLHTLLFQILTHGFVPDRMDCPLAARLALELDDDPARCLRAARQLQPLLAGQYAAALRTRQNHSALALAAGRLAARIPTDHPRNGGIHP